jgi:DNA-binding NarL/FixJ family response regulator
VAPPQLIPNQRPHTDDHFNVMTLTLDTPAHSRPHREPTSDVGAVGVSPVVPEERRGKASLRPVPGGGELVAFDRVRSRGPSRGAAPSRTRLLIAGGDNLLRAGLRMLLEADGRVTVAGEATTGEEAIAAARRISPDVVLLDEELPGPDCVDVTSRMVSEAGVAVMLLTSSECDERIFAALRAGASGLLLKDTEPAELVRALDALAKGGALLSPSFTRRLIDELASRPAPAYHNSEVLDELSAREREVLALVGHGLSNGEIAERLVVSPATAKTHVSRAMVKLRIRARAKLVVLAYEAGLVVPGDGAKARSAQPVSLAT